MALMAAAMGHEGGLLLLVVAGFVPIASYRSLDEVLRLMRCSAVGIRSGISLYSGTFLYIPEHFYNFGFFSLPRQFIERAIFLRSSGDFFIETLCTAPY